MDVHYFPFLGPQMGVMVVEISKILKQYFPISENPFSARKQLNDLTKIKELLSKIFEILCKKVSY